MVSVIGLLFLFIIGSIGGYTYEVIYSKIFHTAENPGSLKGPYIPLYGLGLIIIYAISTLQITFFFKLLLFIFATTGLEFTVGMFYTRICKVELWTYKGQFLNYKGIINPVYSLLWLTFSLLFYFFVFPILTPFFSWLNGNTIMYALILLFCIPFTIDFYKSTVILIKLIKKHPKKPINFEKFRNIRDK